MHCLKQKSLPVTKHPFFQLIDKPPAGENLRLDEFSMNPPAVPLAKQIIRAVPVSEAQKVAAQALACEDPEAVEKLVRGRFPVVEVG